MSQLSAKPCEFKSESELVEMLRHKNTEDKANNFFNSDVLTIKQVVKDGVSGNTFRAFRNLPNRPSVVFRNWAEDYIQKTMPALVAITTSDDYVEYVHEAALNLCQTWLDCNNSRLGYGQSAKLVNLVLKKFVCLKTLSQEHKNTLIPLLHVPLDQYTIVGLRSVASHLSIPRSATMKYIDSPEQYKEFQKIITDITQKAGVPPIYYDILAWDMAH